MNEQEALEFAESALIKSGKNFNDTQRAIFIGAWRGQSYGQICQTLPGYAVDYIERDVAFKLWRNLSEALGRKVTKKNLRGPVEAIARAQKSTACDFFAAIHDHRPWTSPNTPHPDWGNAPDVSGFQGREEDLKQLTDKVRLEGCRLITIFGLGGIGKTFLSVKLAEQVRDQFDFVLWRSLKHWQSSDRPPSVTTLIKDLIQFISSQQDDSSDWSRLRHYLADRRCLIILDSVEAVLQNGVHDGSYQAGYATYGEFFQRIGNSAHDSCVILTSREKPRETEAIDNAHTCAWKLEGFGGLEGRHFLEARRCFSGSESDWRSLIRRYSGNPLALSDIATNILDVFEGNIASFLNQPETLISRNMHTLFDEQFDRLADLERSILHYLTERHEPTKFDMLQVVLQPTSNGHLQEALLSLRRRSWIELDSAHYFLQSLVWEYLSHRFKHNPPLGN